MTGTVVEGRRRHADIPNFESAMPHYNESVDQLITFGTSWQATQGLDVDTEIQPICRTQIQAIWTSSSLRDE